MWPGIRDRHLGLSFRKIAAILAISPHQELTRVGVESHRMKSRQEILSEAMGLPQSERAQLAAELLSSLEGEPEDDPAEVEAAWSDEIARRLEEIDSGRAELLSIDDLNRRMKPPEQLV